MVLPRYILICGFLLCNFYIYGQNMQIYPSLIGLNEFDLPITHSKEWYVLNHSLENYIIDNSGNVIIIKESKRGNYSYNANPGTFIGTNMGEWGGQLKFINDEEEYTILNENICGIIAYNDSIYVLTGLTHLGISEGKIVKIESINGKWDHTIISKFNSSPETFAIFENKLYIVTSNGLIVFNGYNIKQLLEKQFWTSLYPNSVFINDKIIGIGMRGCIAIMDKENKEIKCYK